MPSPKERVKEEKADIGLIKEHGTEIPAERDIKASAGGVGK